MEQQSRQVPMKRTESDPPNDDLHTFEARMQHSAHMYQQLAMMALLEQVHTEHPPPQPPDPNIRLSWRDWCADRVINLGKQCIALGQRLQTQTDEPEDTHIIEVNPFISDKEEVHIFTDKPDWN